MLKLRAVTDPIFFFPFPGATQAFASRRRSAAQQMDIFATSTDSAWLLVFVEQRGARHWWVRARDVEVYDATKPASWTCLAGLHMRADGRNGPADFEIFRRANMQAAKLLSTAAPEDVEALQRIKPDVLIMVRMFASFQGGRYVSADDFAEWMRGDLRPFYERGVRLYEVHNEPNLKDEGWGACWANGFEFSAWFIRVVNNLRYHYRDMRFIFPGLSPAGIPLASRTDDLRFLSEAAPAWRVADGLGVHCYWRDEAERVSERGGDCWRVYRRTVGPQKEMYVTEFSNPSALVSADEKARQYVSYWRQLSVEGGPRAAFAFVSSSSAFFTSEVWRDEHGDPTALGRSIISLRS